MQKLIENAIRKSLNRHLVQHVNVLPDKRCRVDIMVEEATNEILKLVVQPDVSRRSELLSAFSWVSGIGEQFFDSSKTVDDMVDVYLKSRQ